MAITKKKADPEKEELTEKEKPVKKAAVRKTPATKKAAAAKEGEEEKKTTAKKAAVHKSPLTRKAAEEKEEAAAAKAPRKKTAKKTAPAVNIVIEYNGKQVMAEEVIAKVSEAYEKANPDSPIESIDLYIQPEKDMAYYVVNGQFWKDTKVKL